MTVYPRPVVTYTIIATCVVLHVGLMIAGMHHDAVTTWGSLGPFTEPWRMFTSMYLHIGVVHLVVNMYSLWSLRAIESWCGWQRYLLLYIAAGVVAAASNYEDGRLLVGASGAVCGVFGVDLAAVWREWPAMTQENRASVRSSLAYVFIVNATLSIAIPSISVRAHVVGLLVGFIVCMIWTRKCKVVEVV